MKQDLNTTPKFFGSARATATQTTKTLAQMVNVNADRQDLLKLDCAIGAIHPSSRERLGLRQAREATRLEIERLGAEINAYLEAAGVEGRKAAKAAGIWYV